MNLTVKPAGSSACAKVLVFGEHFVLWGGTAIALPMKNTRLHLTAVRELDGETRLLLDGLSPERAKKLLNAAFKAFHRRPPKEGLVISGRSDFPAGQGLGGSASLCVALMRLTATLLEQEADEDLTVQEAHELERLFHGTPSGIDVTAIGFEEPVYLRGASAFWGDRKEAEAGFLSLPSPPPMLVACSGIVGDTAEAVKKVRSWTERANTRRMLGSLTGMAENLALKGASALREGAWEETGRLMNENHVLLASLGLSRKETELIRLAALKAGAWGAKLTGAGLGGSILAIAPEDKLDKVRRAMFFAGAQKVFKI